MTQEEEILLKRFETRTRQMMMQYQELKTENELLYQEVDSLKNALKELQLKYDNLKTARMIDISDQDMKDAKTRLTRLVREIDKCISLLKI